MLSPTICKLLQIIAQIFAANMGCLSLTPSFRMNPYIQDCEIWPQESRDVIRG